MKPRSVTTVRDLLNATRALSPDRSDLIEKLEAELAAAEAAVAARRAVSEGILRATHVRLKDGWVEVVAIESITRIAVKNGENRTENVRLADVLEVYGDLT